MSYAPAFGYQLAAARPRTREPLDLSRWRLAGIGGDMVRMAALSRFAEVFGPHGFRKESFRASYGMAELVLGFSFAPAGEGARAETLDLAALERGEARILPPGAAGGRAFARCGPPLPGHEAEIRDEAGRPLGPGRVGRIFARGPSVMRGYFRDPAATAEALRPGGWLDTGDKGCLIEGELVVTGRAKDLIIVNGRNIWPQDIEWLLETRLEAVREGGAAAFGLDPGSDDEAEGVALVLERRGGPEDAGAAAELRERAAALVRETFGLTPRVALAAPGALPRTSSGKLSRARAREMFRSGAFAG
jgi:fatty-acyl-CoA synthase